ncbi:collagen binding domain-containing protein [Microbacterium sp. NPDC057650]|uniref:MSCRAMM family protein n=1 Tax=unclassified Microbacterium TaxID=2609290 RepID=UPI00366C5725
MTGAVGASAEDDPAPGSISGVVTSDVDGSPVEGVSVSAWTDDGSSSGYATSGADGSYTLEGLTPGDYKVEFAGAPAPLVGEYYDGVHESWEAQWVPVAAAASVTGIDASLEKGGAISGRVTREADGSPLLDVIVQVSNQTGAGFAFASTDADGVYTVSGLLPGDYSVSFNGASAFPGETGLAQEYYDGVGVSEDATLVTVAGTDTTTGIDASLVQGGVVSGTVTRESDGTPVAGVNVSVSTVSGLGSASAMTDENGAYRIVGIFPGEYTVAFSGSDDGELAGEYWNGVHEIGEAQHLVIEAGAETASVDASLEAKATISGTVTRESDGSPVAAQVNIAGEVVDTDAEGRFEVRVNPGTHTAWIVPQDRLLIDEYWQDTRDWSQATPITVAAGENRGGIDVQLASAGVISGTVTTDAPIAEAYIEAWDGDEFAGVASVSEDGSYSLYVAPGTYTLRASGFAQFGGHFVTEYYDSAFAPEDATAVTVSADGTIEGIDFSLERGGDIRGTLSASDDGEPVTAEITAYRRSGDEWQAIRTVTTTTGEYSISQIPAEESGGWLPAGTYTLGVKADGYCESFYGGGTSLAGAKTFTLGAAETLTGIDLNLQRECATPAVVAGTPTIEGEPRMGKVLVAQPGEWGPSGVELQYQWFADGSPIPGAQSDSLHVTGRLRGARISVAVTGTLAGHVTAEASSVILEPAYAGKKPKVPVG